MNTIHRICFTLCFLAVSTAQAHFTFVVPQAGGASALLIVSEGLQPDSGVDIHIAKGAKLLLRDSAGADTPLALTAEEHAYRVTLPGKGSRLVHGLVDLGLQSRGAPGKGHLLIYYPKTILGAEWGSRTQLGADTPVELVPLGEPGKMSLLLLVRGKPKADSEVTVILPGGGEKKVKTDAQGKTEVFSATGRYGAWARFWEPSEGERDGKPYVEQRHYATLVFDALPRAVAASTLPEATSSFGAAAGSGWLYVYGGHTAPTHSYSTKAVSGRFARMNQETRQWETLPGGPGLQGLNMAVYNAKVYRIGGMQPRNALGAKEDNHSVAEAAFYDPAQRRWRELPPLPEPRSSHDVVVIGDRLIVTGGWNLKGEQPSVWAKTTYVMNLADAQPKWETVAQPYERRALIAAVHGGRMYVLGGITRMGKVSADVDIFDPRTGQWSKGPALPGTLTTNFAPAACDHHGALVVSLADGSLYRLNEEAARWEEMGVSTPRLAHRMVSMGDDLWIAGGAAGGKNLDLVEVLRASEPADRP